MRSALRQITEEFGEDAAILSSQKTSTGVEVIAALDYDQDLLPESLEHVSKSRDEFSNLDSEAGPEFKQLTQPSTAVNEEKTKVNISKQTDTSSQVNYQAPNFSPNRIEKGASHSKNLEWSADPGLAAMREELSLMRNMMSEQLKGMGWERFVETEPTKAMLARKFSSLGGSRELADRLIPLVAKNQDAECSWQNLLALFAKSLNVNCENIMTDGGIFAFMGPTGAGKTTSIAKIAARFVIKHGKDSVALISTDNYRISAQHQLASFARLLGVPMASVSKSRSLDELLNQFRNKKLVLIDTAGMSSKDTAILEQLQSIKKSGRGIKRFLMMPATNQLAVLRQSLELFSRFAPYSVIITKLDEAASLGEVVSLLIEKNLPVAFTTDGQRVPEDIRLARSHHLISKAVWLAGKYAVTPEDWQLAQEQLYQKYA